MNPRQVGRSALAAIAVLALLGTNAALADSSLGTPIPFTFAVGTQAAPTGSVLDFGDQTYNASGGVVILPLTEIEGQPVTAATIHFSLSAEVKGLKVVGVVRFDLEGTSGGQPVSVTGQYGVNNAETSTQANAIIISPTGAPCTGKAAKACSELPLSFIGNANVQVKVGSAASKTLKETVLTENPYLNPFGKPIVIASTDSAIVIVATYRSGTILWNGSQVTGAITSGAFGAAPSVENIAGTLGLNSTEHEHLVAGTATDSGTAALTGMSPSIMDAAGNFTGNSVIPTAGELDCSPLFGFPSFPPGQGICTETGFNSVGQYTMSNQGCSSQGSNGCDGQGDGGCNGQVHCSVTITGQYVTTWTIPALSFSTVSAGILTTQR
ncbi:MAG: hypothetical protein OK442_06330 [Thaumarchaeota archaeon]|nr:hypothetical protein [Nitrososphaerota archaeon]